jgi:uncharacterized membrane protein
MGTKESKYLTIMALTTIFVVSFSKVAAAYVGPGAALSLLTSLVGLIGAILMALAIVLFWPLRMLIRRLRGGEQEETSETFDRAEEEKVSSSLDNLK